MYPKIFRAAGDLRPYWSACLYYLYSIYSEMETFIHKHICYHKIV